MYQVGLEDVEPRRVIDDLCDSRRSSEPTGTLKGGGYLLLLSLKTKHQSS